jgi:hypothetical protein
LAITYDPKAAAAARGGPAVVPPVDGFALALLVAANAFSLAWALAQQWPLLLLLWPYWLQSLVIGWYYRRRILALQRFATDGFEIDGKPVAETQETKRTTANFLAMHFGFFHLVYAIFLVAFGFSGSLGDSTGIDSGDALAVAGLGALFAFTQYGEHRRDVALDRGRRPNIGAMMFLPYLRVLPMHVIIIAGAMLGGGSAALVLFGVLKTAADVGMDLFEQRLVARSAKAA